MEAKDIRAIPSQTEAFAIAKKCERMLKEQFSVREVYLFGSVTGESPWHDRSDIDIAVEGLSPQDYFRALIALDDVLPSSLGVDLITLEDALPEMAARIRGERKMPENYVEAMKGRIADELRSLERVVRGLQAFLKQAPEQPSEIEMRGVASYVHDFYNGIERIFERIAVTLDGGLPEGERWHQQLLQQMVEERPGVRPAVIDSALSRCLLEYLRFRHLVRNIYGDELLWHKLRPLAEDTEEALANLCVQLADFEDAFEI